MRSPKFSTDNADYYLVYAHHSNISYDDFPIVGPLLGRLFGKKRLDKTNSKVYPTFEDIFAKDKIKSLDGIVLENYEADNGASRLNRSDQYKKIIKSIVENKAKVPIYFVDVDVKTDHQEVYKVVAGFGLAFLATAAAMGTYGTVRRHRAKKLEKLEGLIGEETERHKGEQERLKAEYNEVQSMMEGSDIASREGLRPALDDKIEKLQMSTMRHEAEVDRLGGHHWGEYQLKLRKIEKKKEKELEKAEKHYKRRQEKLEGEEVLFELKKDEWHGSSDRQARMMTAIYDFRLKRVGKRMERSTRKYNETVDKIEFMARFDEKNAHEGFKKQKEKKGFTRRDFLKCLGVSTAYLGLSAYFCGGHLVWPYMLAYDRGESGDVAPYVTYLQTELFPTTTINLRNAIWARKIEEVIAPRLEKKLKRKPTIALVVGTNHAGLKWYLTDKSKREKQLKRYEHEILKMYKKNKRDLNGVREIIFDKVTCHDSKKSNCSTSWNSEFLENKGLIL